MTLDFFPEPTHKDTLYSVGFIRTLMYVLFNAHLTHKILILIITDTF